jgi:GDP-L-fucose synthase
MKRDSRIMVAGHRGLVGSALVRKLKAEGYTNLILKPRQELDLFNQVAVDTFFKKEKPEFVFLAAARAGGIGANSAFQADFLYENLMIACNVIHAAAQNDTQKLLFLGSSCIYPKMAPQPIKEESLLTSALEPTNEGYAIAKIAGLKLCEMYRRQYGKNFISAMPTNLYGPGDNFHPEHSHVIPGMMRRFHEAASNGSAEVTVWGTGTPRREFLFVDDLAEALVLLMQKYEDTRTINVGTGEDLTIKELSDLMSDVVGFKGRIKLDPSKPDGTPRKVMDVSRMRSLGWSPRVSLRDGLRLTHEWATKNGKF